MRECIKMRIACGAIVVCRELLFSAESVTMEQISARRGVCMEVYYYKCPVCGFIYQVPAYWVSYSPEDTTDFAHLSLINGQMCENITLELQPDQ